MEEYACAIAQTAKAKQGLSPGVACGYEENHLSSISPSGRPDGCEGGGIGKAVFALKDTDTIVEESCAIRDTVLAKMSELRAVADEAETVTAEKYWPFPTYGDLLFGVR